MKKVLLLTIPVLALTLGGWGSVAEAQHAGKVKAMSIQGTVKSIAPDTVVVSDGNRDWTFTVDGSTRVVGKGAGTKAAPKSGRAVITDLLRSGDMISVTYHETETMHAAVIYVTNWSYSSR